LLPTLYCTLIVANSVLLFVADFLPSVAFCCQPLILPFVADHLPGVADLLPSVALIELASCC
jgi:hypothetical protein